MIERNENYKKIRNTDGKIEDGTKKSNVEMEMLKIIIRNAAKYTEMGELYE